MLKRFAAFAKVLTLLIFVVLLIPQFSFTGDPSTASIILEGTSNESE